MSAVPKEFCKVMKDFLADMMHTFPEYNSKMNEGMKDILMDKYDTEEIKELFLYCQTIYPERFFDFLYQNNDIFTDPSKNTLFLPHIEFMDIWKQDITDKTRLIIWKYLQLILFSIINNQKDGNTFGDTAKLFEAINEEELKKKLEETMKQMGNLFDMSNNPFENVSDTSGINLEELPDPEELHNHISGLMDGKLGRLAAQITEETMKEFEDISGVESVEDIFKTLFKNPGRLLNMIKKIGGNLDEKLKSGEIKESELLEEASELMEKLNKMPGMKNMQQMLGQMGMPMPSKGKVNMGAFQGQMKQNIRSAKMKERMRYKLKKKQDEKDEQIRILQQQLATLRHENNQALQTGTHVANNLNGQNEILNTEPVKKKKRRRRKKRKGRNKK